MATEPPAAFSPLASLPALAAPRAGRAINVCLVTSEIVGPSTAGGIATATSALARQLVADGHQVTILYTQVEGGWPYAGSSTWPDWVAQYRDQGIALHHIASQGSYEDWRGKSWLVMQFLKELPFDLVYFNEHHGSGYYAISAKRAGIAPFAAQTYGVILHGGMEWVLRHDDLYMRRPSDLLLVGMERRSVEWADFVLSPSGYLLREYGSYGWRLPAASHVQPYPLLRRAVPATDQEFEVDELVFFGRLETRKGLWLFCEAIERIAERLRGKSVTFMGRMPETAGVSVGALLVARAARWPFSARFATWFSTPEALEYLQRPGKLAVMPSLADNSPCVLYECMEKGIPFLATTGSGAEELVAPAQRAAVLSEPTAPALAAALERILTSGARRASTAFKPEQVLRTWKAWHAWLSEGGAQPPAAKRAPLATAGGAGEEPVLLNVVIDQGDCRLATLLEHLRLQCRFLGRSAGHLVLTTRGAGFQQLLSTLLQDLLHGQEAPVMVLGVEEAAQAREIILDADVAYFSDASYHVDLAFYLRSTPLLRTGQAALVSCFAGLALPGERALTMASDDMPCGDLPGAAAVQAPLASPVWAVALSQARPLLESLPLHDAALGEWLPSAALAQRVAQRCQLGGRDYLLLPMLAARRLGAPRHRPEHWYRDLAALAGDLGVPALAYPDAAPWFGMSAYGDIKAKRTPEATRRPRFPGALPRQLEKLAPDTALADRLRELSKRLGRPGLGVQLAVPDRALEQAADQIAWAYSLGYHRREEVDLLARLPAMRVEPAAEDEELPAAFEPPAPAEPPAKAGQPAGRRGAAPARPESATKGAALAGLVPAGRQSGWSPSVLVGQGLAVRQAGHLRCRTTAATPGVLALLDVPLDRQERLTLTAKAAGKAAVEWEVTVYDQQLGHVVAQRQVRSLAGTARPVVLQLPKMLGELAVIIEIRGGGESGLLLESAKLG